MRIGLVFALFTAAATAQTLPPKAPAAAPRRAPAQTHAPNSATAGYRDLKFPPLASIATPKLEAVTLPNGLRLYLFENHELPVIHGLAMVHTGRLLDPADKAGLAGLTAQLVRAGGAGTRNNAQIDEQLGIVGARVDSRTGDTSAVVTFTGLSESIPSVLEIFCDVLTKPLFDSDRLDALKGQERSAVGSRNADAEGVTRRELAVAIFGKTSPQARVEDYTSLAAIRRKDVLDFYSRYYFPKNTIVAVWGDFDAAKMKEDLTNLFAGWKAEQPAPVFPEAHAAAEPATLLGVRKDLKQTVFSMGSMGGKLNDKDYPALEIAVSILGRGAQSRLARRFRGKSDLGETATIRADWGAEFETPGVFRVFGVIPSFTAVSLLKSAQTEVGLLGSTEVTDEELEGAKTEVTSGLAFGFDTAGKAIGNVITYANAGYPLDFAQQAQKLLLAVSKADVQRVAKQYLDPARLSLVVLGNPSQFVEELSALGRKVTPLELTLPDAVEKPTEETVSTLAAGKKILAAAQAAVGGVDALIAAKDYTEHSDLQLDAGFGGASVPEVIQWLSPGYLRQEEDLPTGKLTSFTDGEVGWVAIPRGSAALGGNDLRKVKGDLFRNYIPLLLSDRVAGRKIVALDDNSIEISDAAGNRVRADFDLKTNLLRKLVYTTFAGNGASQAMVETYSDFRDVNGIKIPFKVSAEIGGRKYGEGVTREVRLNSGLKVEELRKRP